MRRWLRSLIRPVLRRSRLQADLDSEIRFHLDARADDLMKTGLTRPDAERLARLEFGMVEAHKDDARQAAGLRWLGDLAADLRYATRLARRQPVFAGVAILSLALGIGLNTLVFSVINGLILRPLPVDRPDRLAFVERGSQPSLSYPDYRDIRDRNSTLAGLIAYRVAPMTLDRNGAATRVWGYLATGNYFDVLGVRPAVGTFFHQADDRPPIPSPIAVLSYDCWTGKFDGDPKVVGRSVRINGMPYTIIGVAPRGFVGTELFYRPELWVPMTMQPQIEARESWLEARRTDNAWVIGRLRDGVTREEAQANLESIAAALSREYPDSEAGLRLVLSDAGLLGSALGSPVKAFTAGVLALAALVLLMACVNLAVVLSASGAERQRELAIRLSIGAGAGRLIRQTLTETLLLGITGGIVGLALAALAARALSAWRLPVELPVQFDVSPDPVVFLFALALSLLASVSFGLMPARHAARTDANAALKGTRPSTRLAGRRWSVRDVLVTVQVTACVVLLAGSLLAVQGARAAITAPIGYEPRGAAMVGFDLGLSGYDEAHGREFLERVVEAVGQIPGVDSAAYSDTLPLNIDQSTTTIFPEDQPNLKVSEALDASRYRVSPGFFATLVMPLVSGRGCEARDTADAPLVAVVNRTFARSILRTPNPLGHRFRYGWGGRWIEVVGEVEDGKYQSLSESARPAVFECVRQHYSSSIVVTARSSLPPDRIVPRMRAAIGRLDPTLALYETESLDDMLAFVRVPNQVAATALGAFGVLAVLLAVTGLHGVVAQAVTRRRKEIGIRRALGAGQGRVLWIVLGRMLALLAAGSVAGSLLSWLAGGLLGSVVYGASLTDPVVIGGIAAGLVATGVVSCWGPARRAIGVSPMTALRTD